MRNSDETQQSRVSSNSPEPVGQTQDQPDKAARKQKQRQYARLVGLGLLGILILSLLAAVGGYFIAEQDRLSYADTIVSTEVTDQFLLGLIEMERGQYENARQRFEYILKIDPTNKAAAEKLTEAILKLNETDQLPTPTFLPSVTPTPDARNQEELFATAMAYRDVQDWNKLLETIDTLRFRDPNFKMVDVDGLYFLAYRNRGLHRIQVEGNLEEGIFDLNRAELYGLLDVEASNYRNWATKYITGLSFWEVDWQEVVNYFQPLAISAPYLSDSSFFTAQDRLATAQVEVNFQVVITARAKYAGQKWCDAYNLFNEATAYLQLEPEDLEKFELARNQCFVVAPTEEAPPSPTP